MVDELEPRAEWIHKLNEFAKRPLPRCPVTSGQSAAVGLPGQKALRVGWRSSHPHFGAYGEVAELVEQLNCSTPERELIYSGSAERLFNLV